MRFLKNSCALLCAVIPFWESVRWGTGLRLGDWTLAGELVVQKESEEEGKTCVAFGDALASSGDNMKVSETKECFVCLSSVMVCVHRIHAYTHAKGHKVGSGDGEGKEEVQEEPSWSYLPVSLCPRSLTPAPHLATDYLALSIDPRLSSSSQALVCTGINRAPESAASGLQLESF